MKIIVQLHATLTVSSLIPWVRRYSIATIECFFCNVQRTPERLMNCASGALASTESLALTNWRLSWGLETLKEHSLIFPDVLEECFKQRSDQCSVLKEQCRPIVRC
ncbi:hypothetical protein HETIRDRAFT_435327 [Heterobasidion irregulare TC 32-1]|uniref:Uncharacterized protein n=1 Tax=Heterobasidion irregulare (strain TC 32-1) TaxID=747525 RepID=W4JZT5_HETIT|nr:uncharacterized protein HETIRDRAFT_435327 [Heterobasidion irregulare TC 32-1]ETW78600.1 hypothetical protein HETIRDRAFT_435327 [Heterobasidion irregulare TC 32-1]